MNARCIAVLLGKELHHGLRNFIVLFAMLAPILLSLAVTLIFGRLASQTPRLGILSQDKSELLQLFQTQTGVEVLVFDNADQLRAAVERGRVAMGILVPAGFADAVQNNKPTSLTIWFWGEAPILDQAVLITTLAQQIQTLSGRPVPVQVEPVVPGGEVVAWSERLLPLLVLMAIVLGGTLIPAVSLMSEKEQRTLQALTITPASLRDVLAAKAGFAMIISSAMGGLMVGFQGGFAALTPSVILILVVDAAIAAVFGLVLATLTNTMNQLLTVIKGLGLVLYAPALIELVPPLPNWLARIFPTYYMVAPLQRLMLEGATIGANLGFVAILLIVLGLLISGLWLVVRQKPFKYRPASTKASV